MVSSDAALRYVPFAARYDGQQYLAQSLATALYVAAAREGVDNPPKPAWQVAAMGVSLPHQGLSALPSVPDELRAVVRDAANPNGALPGEHALDQHFTAAHLQNTLRANRPSVVHLATHYRFSPYGEHENFLLLGDGQRLTLHQFRTGAYRLAGVDLFTLSACETAVGADGGGAEVEGLAAIAQKKGARAVMATLWPVADASTAQFMRRFYDARQNEHQSKAQALRQTQIEMITGRITRTSAPAAEEQRGGRAPGANPRKTFTPDANAPLAHPFYWAPYVIMGNWL
ncbi:MAG: CHAT domain-containing protein [Burkholderiaceae bacterium]